MKRVRNIVGKGLMLFAAISFGLLSCDDNQFEFSSKDSNSVENEAASETYYEDVDDMTALAISADASTSTGINSGRVGVKPSDSRFTCATVTFEFAADNSITTPHGYITVDFGTGCTDAHGNVRKGVIKIEFKGRRFMPNAQVITTLNNYYINDVKIEGTRTVINSTESLETNPKFTITVQGGKATWPDGTFATREASRTREWLRAVNPLNDEWIITGSAAGTNRDGVSYMMEITSPLVYKRSCFSTSGGIAVEGTKVLTVDSKEISIDYGTGSCDKMITITVNGQSKQIEVNGHM